MQLYQFIIIDSTRLDDSPYPMQVRLTDSDHRSEGRVEVYCNGQWGTICGDNFDNFAADTVCRQLGYTTAVNFSLTDRCVIDVYLFSLSVQVNVLKIKFIFKADSYYTHSALRYNRKCLQTNEHVLCNARVEIFSTLALRYMHCWFVGTSGCNAMLYVCSVNQS